MSRVPAAQSDPDDRLVDAEDLTAGYGNRVVWRNASFTIGQGEFVAVIGPNGAGKTTLFRLILGLQTEIGGRLEVFGAPPKRGNRLIGYVPQHHMIDEESHIAALELVRLGFSGNQWGFNLFANLDRAAALSALEAVGAEEIGRRPLAGLSGGELQRIFLAEALVSSPRLLLLDEPMSNLDMRREAELLRLISDVVRSRNVSALLIGHNINPILRYLDRVIYMANGKVASGRPEEVLTSRSLSDLYETEIEVLRDSRGNVAVLGIDVHHGDR